MKKTDITAGEEYAVAPGSGDYYERYATRARIIEVGVDRETRNYSHSFHGVRSVRKDGVLVEITEDPPRLYSSGWEQGKRLLLSTRNVLHPWEVEEGRREARERRDAHRNEQEQCALRAIRQLGGGSLSNSPRGPKVLLTLEEAEGLAARLAESSVPA